MYRCTCHGPGYLIFASGYPSLRVTLFPTVPANLVTAESQKTSVEGIPSRHLRLQPRGRSFSWVKSLPLSLAVNSLACSYSTGNGVSPEGVSKMPSRYSHGVVLATYASHGILNLPQDNRPGHPDPLGPHLHVTLSRESQFAARDRTSSAQSARRHDQETQANSATSAGTAKERFSAISECKEIHRQNDRARPPHFYDTLDKSSRAYNTQLRDLKFIPPSDRDSTGNGFSNLETRPGKLSASMKTTNTALRSSSLSISTLDISASIARPRSSKPMTKPHVDNVDKLTQPALRHAKGHSAQNGRAGAVTPLQSAPTPSPQQRRSRGKPRKSLLTVHEFLHLPFSTSKGQTIANEPIPLDAKQTHKNESVPRMLPALHMRPSRKTPKSLARLLPASDQASDTCLPDRIQRKHSLELRLEAMVTPDSHKGNNVFPPKFLGLTKQDRPDTDNIDGPQNTIDLHDDSLPRTHKKQRNFGAGGNNHTSAAWGDDVVSNDLARETSAYKSNSPAKATQGIGSNSTSTLGLARSGAHSISAVPLEPNFSHFSDDEELQNPMDRQVFTDDAIQERYCNARSENGISQREPKSPTSNETLKRSSHGHYGTPSWSAASVNSAATSERAPKNVIQKQRSEEEIRMRIPTPIPSPTSLRRGEQISTLLLDKRSPLLLSTPPSPQLTSNFGMPSIVRSPPKPKQGEGRRMSLSSLQTRSSGLQTQDSGVVTSPAKAKRMSWMSGAGSFVGRPSAHRVDTGWGVDNDRDGPGDGCEQTATPSQKEQSAGDLNPISIPSEPYEDSDAEGSALPPPDISCYSHTPRSKDDTSRLSSLCSLKHETSPPSVRNEARSNSVAQGNPTPHIEPIARTLKPVPQTGFDGMRGREQGRRASNRGSGTKGADQDGARGKSIWGRLRRRIDS